MRSSTHTRQPSTDCGTRENRRSFRDHDPETSVDSPWSHSRSKVGVCAWKIALLSGSSRKPNPSKMTSTVGEKGLEDDDIGIPQVEMTSLA